MAYPAIRRLLMARKVEVHDDDEVLAHWRRYEIHVQRYEGVSADWYITVRVHEAGFIYDGWWRDSEDKTLAEAVEEAFRGACLLEQSEELSHG